MDRPWWKVRSSLLITLTVSTLATLIAYRVAGLASPDQGALQSSLGSLFNTMSATPTLLAIGVLAILLTVRKSATGSLRGLYGVLAIAALVGVGLNIARETFQQFPLETLTEQALKAPQNWTAQIR